MDYVVVALRISSNIARRNPFTFLYQINNLKALWVLGLPYGYPFGFLARYHMFSCNYRIVWAAPGGQSFTGLVVF